jgi:hypothetical protein
LTREFRDYCRNRRLKRTSVRAVPWREKASSRELLAIVAIYRMPESSGMEFVMASPGTSTLVDRHSKRLLVDIAEWRDRLEQLAEMRRAAAVSAPSEGAIADLKPRAPQAPA